MGMRAFNALIRNALIRNALIRNALNRNPLNGNALIRNTLIRSMLSGGLLLLLLHVDALADATATRWSPVQVVVYKSKRLLAVYRQGVFETEYPVVLGLAPDGPKRHAFDARTPEGLYRVNGKRAHGRWQFFLSLDYPNAIDRSAYEQAIGQGKIPDENGQPFGIGDSIGIHGNDRATEQDAGTDWTKGCIAMKPDDIAALSAVVVVGTPVWIVE